MAGKGGSGRKYVRDNRGRFATTGATARGGRLKTASGNKRQTVKSSPGISKKLSSVPSGGIAKTRSGRAVDRIDRPSDKKPAFNSSYSNQKSSIQSRKARPAQPAAGSAAANNIQAAKGRVKQFTSMKKVVDSDIRKVRGQIKEARSNASTFGRVPGLRLKLLELQSVSKRHKDTIAKAKASIKP